MDDNMKRIVRIGGLILVNLVVVLLLLEIGLRLAVPVLPEGVAVAVRWVTTGETYAEDWQPAWQDNIDLRYALRPGLENSLQYGSPTVSFTLSTIEPWDGAGIGFRTDPVDFRVDAVVVGDSFGLCFVERADCWVEHLAADTGLGIVNLSQPVTGTRSHLRIAQDFATVWEPPLLIWQFFGNDFNDDYQLAVFRDEIEAMSTEEETAEAPETFYDTLRRNSALVAVLDTLATGYFRSEVDPDFIKPHRATYGDNQILQFGGAYELTALDMSLEQNQIGYELSAEAFADAQELVNGWDGQLVVVLIPTREEVYQQITAPIMGQEAIETLASAREEMLSLCEELELVCYDALPLLQERAMAGEVLYFRDDMHLNPTGNAALAADLTGWLQANNYLPNT